MEDYYSVLGLSKNASQDEIKQAYRKLASRYHPDHGGDTAKFQQLQTAYSILSDPEQRARYDNPSPFSKFFSDSFDFSQFDFFKQHVRQPITRISLWLDISDVYTLAKKIVTININSHYHNMEIDIPPGLEDGHSVRYQKIGSSGEDIIVIFRIRSHPVFSKNGSSLVVEQNCNIWQMICGGELSVTDPAGGVILVNVPPRTKPGTRLRLKNRGFHALRGGSGDMLVHLNAVIPDQISTDLLENIKKEITKSSLT